MSRSINARLIILLTLWLLALWFPWWLVLAAALVAIWTQPNFYELLLLGWWYDAVYGPGGSLIAPNWPFLATLVAFVLVWAAGLAKENVVIYRRSF